MRRLAGFSALSLLFLSTLPALKAQRAEVIDGVAAIVNTDVITISQVRELIGARERALREAYQGPDLPEKIK
jgi:peptidyl-prolyl cis-trans isomerase SurA